MTSTRRSGDILDREFLGIRHAILDVAAALDRIDDGEGIEALGDDPRMAQIGEALQVLGERETARADRVQMAFSRAYDPDWRG